MDREFAHFEGLEAAIRELDSAEREGVFARTRIDARALLCAEPPSRIAYPVWIRRLGSVAAVLVVATGVWSWMFVDQLGKLGGRSGETATVHVATFSNLTGPAVASNEKINDYDSDGDLDLADYRTFQLQFGATQ